MNCLGPSMMTNFPNNHHYSINIHSKFPVIKNENNSRLASPMFSSSPRCYINRRTPAEAKTEMDRQNINCIPPVSQNSNTGRTKTYESHSSCIVPNEHNPFGLVFNKNVCGEHSGTPLNSPVQHTVFSSTRPTGWNYASNAQISSFITNKSISNVATNPLPSRENETRHITTLKINPVPPYTYNPSSSITRNVTSSGRHMTSVNLQLQPPSSDPQTPMEITTTPLSCGASQKENSNFNSHVQISISSTGATLTAVRTNRKPPTSCSIAEQQLPAQRTTSTSMISINNPSSMQEPDISNARHSSGHYNAALQNHSQTIRSVNLLNVPQSQESVHHQPNQQLPFYHPAVTDNQSAHTDVPNEFAYTQALLLQQKERLNFIQTLLRQERDILARVKTEVNKMEKDLLQRRLDLTAVSNMADIQNLREENRRLRVECHCLSMEVDLNLRGQVPLGETDEDFYRNIFTGPIGPLLSQSSCQEESNFTSTMDLPSEAINNEGLATEAEDTDLWKCSKCTFANHPALNKCEMCEMERLSCSGPTYHTQYHRMINAPQTRQRVSPERSTRTWPRHGIGHVQIRVTQNRSTVPSKGLDIHLTHRYPRR